MRILTTLTYYRPHYSGLTIYTERLARALAADGNQVTILTSQFIKSLARDEVCNGVRVIRMKVMARISKGVIMPGMLFEAWRQIRKADVVNLHVPQLDAAPIAVLARLLGKPVVLTYHCDLRLPYGFIHWLANQVSHFANHVSARAANVIVTNTRDYAENSPFLSRYLGKVHVIPPPVELPSITEDDIQAFREKYNIKPEEIIIGIAARLATEKGVEYLIEALPGILNHYPTARVLFVGQYQDVLGEEQYAAMLAPLIKELGEHWSFLGVISPVELAVFFNVSEVTVLPSINPTESFGMVQVESMTCGTPVVATDLPGVRQPVLTTGMGVIVPQRDPAAIQAAIIDIIDHPKDFSGDWREVMYRYAPATIAKQYEKLFQQLLGKK